MFICAHDMAVRKCTVTDAASVIATGTHDDRWQLAVNRDGWDFECGGGFRRENNTFKTRDALTLVGALFDCVRRGDYAILYHENEDEDYREIFFIESVG